MSPNPYDETSSEDLHDCPLCLCPLESYDIKHPIQCSSHHCAFNFCIDCIESLIKSTKDEVEASDDNVFKVMLNCPNCRSDLGPSIRDTVLLRKVDKYKALKHITQDGKTVKDEELSASELRFKHGLEKDMKIASAIEAAQERERQFLRTQSESNLQFVDLGLESLEKKGEMWSFDDEEGFEADIEGRAQSFVFKHHSVLHMGKQDYDAENDLTNVKPDKTLLYGLETFMTDQEKQYITYLLTSGKPNNLAAAAELLDRVAHLSRLGQNPCIKRQSSMYSSKSIKRSMLESIRNVIKEGNDERDKKNLGKQFNTVGTRREQKLLNDLEYKREMKYMAKHPLPSRMPKYAEIVADEPDLFALSVIDDRWDGSVQDAFSRLIIHKGFLGGKIHVKKQYSETPAIRRIIDACSARHDGKGIIDIEKPRVLVSSVTREAGMQGVVAGDVLSHVNGDEFLGTAEELRTMISDMEEGRMVTFAFNADKAVAEALRRRSLNFEG